MVEDGTTWFSNPGEGGQADNQIEAIVEVMPGATMSDAGTTTDAGSVDADTDASSVDADTDAVAMADGAADVLGYDAESAGDASTDAANVHDGGIVGDASSTPRDAGDGGASTTTARCGCSVVATHDASQRVRFLLVIGVALTLGNRRRRRGNANEFRSGANRSRTRQPFA